LVPVMAPVVQKWVFGALMLAWTPGGCRRWPDKGAAQ
jgi:hypothetical protein